MPKPTSQFSAELLWAKIPSNTQARILEAMWCAHCSKAVKIDTYTVHGIADSVILHAHCPDCGGEVRRYIEPQDLGPLRLSR